MSDVLMTPMPGRIVIRRDQASSATPGGILMPEKSRPQLARGEIVAASEWSMTVLPDGSNVKMRVKVGDHVAFMPMAGIEIDADGEKFVVMNDTDVLVIMPKPPATE